MEIEELWSFGERYTAAWCSQDAASVAAFFSDAGSLQINNGAPSVGRAAITAAAAGFMTAFPDLIVTTNGVGLQGDRAVYRWTLTGTNTGPGGSGKVVRIRGYEEWRFGADGLIGESKRHFDEASYERQLWPHEPDAGVMWRELISGLFADAKFATGCTADDVSSAERELGITFPPELRALFLETNGVSADYGTDFVWPVALLVANNQLYREDADFAQLYMSFDSLLLCGDAGNGDHFGYRILAAEVRDTSWIYKWDHENDNREWYAMNLEDFFRRSVPKGESGT